MTTKYECAQCATKFFSRPESCGSCGCEQFDAVNQGKNSGNVVCRNCGFVGYPQKQLRGHVLITATFWLIAFFLFPSPLCIIFMLFAIVYMVSRRKGLRPYCYQCASGDVYPEGSKQYVARSAGPTKSKTESPETHMKCDDCREWILIGAKKCKHCGSMVSHGHVN